MRQPVRQMQSLSTCWIPFSAYCFPCLIRNIIREVLKWYTCSLSVSHSYNYLIICEFCSRSEPSFCVIWHYRQLVPGEIGCCASYSLWKYSPCCTSSRFPKWNDCNLKNTHTGFNKKDGNSHTPSSISAHYKAQLTFAADLSLWHLLSFSLPFYWGLFFSPDIISNFLLIFSLIFPFSDFFFFFNKIL